MLFRNILGTHGTPGGVLKGLNFVKLQYKYKHVSVSRPHGFIVHSVQVISRVAKFNGGGNFINQRQTAGTRHARPILVPQVGIESLTA